MSVAHNAHRSPTELTGKELEVLRLLAGGHTVKSIAVQLGRSEASINERLRDARRKAGVGSSRELARRLAAQENWDRKFDLSAGEADGNIAAGPSARERFATKGTLFMLLTLTAAAAALLIPAANDRPADTPRLSAEQAAPSLLAGRWTLDTSSVPEAERPRTVTIAFHQSPDRRWETRVEIVAANGSSRYAESTAAADGVPVPVAGTMGFIDTVALRQPASNTLVMTLGKGGTPVSTRVYAVAKDGLSMTETIVWPGDKMPKLETTRFVRAE